MNRGLFWKKHLEAWTTGGLADNAYQILYVRTVFANGIYLDTVYILNVRYYSQW